MSLTLASPHLPEPARRELRAAFDALEHPSLAARLAGMAGMPVEAQCKLAALRWPERVLQFDDGSSHATAGFQAPAAAVSESA